jgi:hypothetical protein
VAKTVVALYATKKPAVAAGGRYGRVAKTLAVLYATAVAFAVLTVCWAIKGPFRFLEWIAVPESWVVFLELATGAIIASVTLWEVYRNRSVGPKTGKEGRRNRMDERANRDDTRVV